MEYKDKENDLLKFKNVAVYLGWAEVDTNEYAHYTESTASLALGQQQSF